MERKTFATSPCSIARSLDVLGDWWTPLIVRECLYGVHRFDEMQAWLGVGRNILTKRLALLVQQGVIERRQYLERPARFEYHLTAKGYAAAGVLVSLMPFGEAWYFGSGKEPIVLFDRKTGRRVRPVLTDGDTGRPIDVRHLYAGPGPSFPNKSDLRLRRFPEYYARDAKGPAPRPPADEPRRRRRIGH